MGVKQQKIVELRIKNMRSIDAVEVSPDGSLIPVKGRNGAGKSTVLDSIMWGFKGKIPGGAVKKGAPSGEISIETEDFFIRRIVSDGGKGRLELTTRDGLEIKRPQDFLDRLSGTIAFDPFDFANKKGREQGEILREVVGLDLAPVDRRISSAETERKMAHRDVQKLKAEVEGKSTIPGVKEVSVADLMAQLKTAQEHNRGVRGLCAKLDDVESNIRTANRRKDELKADISRLEREIASKNAEIDEVDAKLKEHDKAADEIKAQISESKPVDEGPIIKQMEEADKINAQVRHNKELVLKREQLEEAEAVHHRHDAEIKSLRGERLRLISECKMPVNGLSFSDDGTVLYNDVELTQCSTAEKLRVAVAVAVAMNPSLRVILVREGSLLDREGKEILADLAAEFGVQVWMEVVSDDEPGGAENCIYIEEGAVVH